MDADDVDDLIERIEPCLEAHAEAGTPPTAPRRRAMARFFHFAALYSAGPNAVADAPDHLLAVFSELFAAAERLTGQAGGSNEVAGDILDRAVDGDKLRRTVAGEVNAVGWIVAAALDAVWKQLLAGNEQGAAADASAALRQVFAWKPPGGLRSYVFARTGEMIRDGLLHKERSMLLAALQQCLQEDGE